MLQAWVLVAGLGGCLRYGLIGFAAAILVAASLVPDDAFARRGGGGGFRSGGGSGIRAGGGIRARGFQGGRGYRVAGGPRPSHPIARPPIAGRPGAPDRWCAGPSDSRVSWLRLARRGVWSCRRRCRSAGGSPLIAFAISATGARSTGGALGLTVPSSVLVR